MNHMTDMRTGIALCAFLFCTTPVVAQDAAGTPATPSFQRAYDVAMSRIAQELPHDHIVTINRLGYAAAAGALCPGLSLDEAAVYGALTESSQRSLHGATAEEGDTHQAFTLIAFGVVTGLILENAASDEAAFCQSAEAAASGNGNGLLAFAASTGEAATVETAAAVDPGQEQACAGAAAAQKSIDMSAIRTVSSETVPEGVHIVLDVNGVEASCTVDGSYNVLQLDFDE